MDVSRRALLKAQAAVAAASRRRHSARRTGTEPHRRRGHPDQMVEGAVPVLRHRLRRDGRRQGRAGSSPRTATCRRRSIAASTASRATSFRRSCTAPTGSRSRCCACATARSTRTASSSRCRWDQAFDEMARAVEARAEGEGSGGRRHVRLGPMDDLRRLCRHQADARRLPLEQSRPQCAPLHGVGRRRPSSAPSAWTSRWAATTTSSMPTRSCCGAPTWPRCIRSCGPG